MVLTKPTQTYAKPLHISDQVVTASLTIGSSTITPGGAQSISDRVLDTYYIQNSQIENTVIGAQSPASGAFTFLTTGTSKGIGFPVTFYGSTAGTSAAWDPYNSVWKVTSNGQPNGGLQSDNLLIQGNTLKAVNANNQGPIYLTPQTNVVIPSSTFLKFDGIDSNSGSGIQNDTNGALVLQTSKCIKLQPVIAVTIPTGIPLLFDGICYVDGISYRSGIVNEATTSKLIVGGQNGIDLSTPPTAAISIKSPSTPLIFGPTSTYPSITGDTTGNNLSITANSQVNLSTSNVLLPTNSRLNWGSSPNMTYIDVKQGFEFVNTLGDVRLKGNGNIVLGPAGDIIIPNSQLLTWQNCSTSLGANGQNQFTIHTAQSPIILDSGAQTIQILGSNPSVVFSDSGHLITATQKDLSITTPNSQSESITIASPEIILKGNVVVQGSSTTIETTNIQAKDPVIELGVGLSSGNVQDRGHISEYGATATTAYWGYQPKVDAFAFLNQAVDDGTGHYIGQYGDLLSASISLSNGVINTPKSTSLKLETQSIDIMNNAPLYFNPTTMSGLQFSSVSNTLQVLNSPGISFDSGAALNINGPDIHLQAASASDTQGAVIIDNNVLSFANGPVLSAGSQDMLTLTNTSNLQLPEIFKLNFGQNINITSDPTGSLTYTAPADLVINTNAVTGTAQWQAQPIALQYGGTGGTNWQINGGICYVDTAANQMKTSANFIYEQSTATILFQSLTQGTTESQPTQTTTRVNATSLSLQNTQFSFTDGLFCFGAPLTTTTVWDTTTAIYLDPQFNAMLTGRVYFDTMSATYIQSNAGNLLLQASVVSFTGSQIQAQSATTPLSCLSPFQLTYDSNGRIEWTGSDGPKVLKYDSTLHRFVFANGGVLLPSGSVNGLLWQNGNGWFEDVTGLNFQGSSLNIPQNAKIQFESGICLSSTTWSSPNPLRLEIPQVILDGNLRILGTTTEVISQTSILDDQFLKLGKGRLLVVDSVINNTSLSSATTYFVSVITDTPHDLRIGDHIQLLNLDCSPDIEGSYDVVSIIDTKTFTIQVQTSLTQPGTQGTLRAPLTSDSRLDVGLQLNRYNASAFIAFQDRTQRFIFLSDGENVNNVVQDEVFADAQINTLYLSKLGACTLVGDLNADSYSITGQHFRIGGGSITNVSLDQWTTGTTTVIANLNAEFLQNYHANAFVHRDGTLSMTNDWIASTQYQLTSGKLAATNLTFSAQTTDITSIVFANTAGVLVSDTSESSDGYRYIYYNTTLHRLVCSLDVSNPNNTLILRDYQIPGNKIGAGLAECDTTGNAGTVTNGVYTTQYTAPNSILVRPADQTAMLQNVEIPEGTFIGNINGTVQALNANQIRQYLGPYKTYEIIDASPPNTLASSIINADITVELTKLKVPDRSKTGITGNATYSAILPNGTIEGQTKTIRALIQQKGDQIQVHLQLSTPDFNGTVGPVLLNFVNSGQSATLQWDNDLQAWYNISSGVDVFIIYQ